MIGVGRTEPARARSLTQHYEHCSALVHLHDRDRWLASLFAPADKRPHLHALYAFNIEIARIRDVVSDPMPGEIRMRWWIDALEDAAGGEVRAHPVADAFLDTIAQDGLARADFAALIETRRFDLYDDPMPNMRALLSYSEGTASCLFRAATQILTGESAAEAAHAAGVAYGITGLLRALPLHAARGQCFLPADLLAERGTSPAQVIARRNTPAIRGALGQLRTIARDHFTEAVASAGSLEPAVHPAFLPLAVVPLYLAAMERRDSDPFSPTEVPLWRRQWRLWRTSRRA